MPNPTPQYAVKFAGTTLPGYAQTEDVPLAPRVTDTAVLGRDGGLVYQRGTGTRDIAVSMRVLTRLSSGTGKQHLSDCLDQWRDALSTCSRASVSGAHLYLGDTDRYINAVFAGSTAPLAAKDSKAVTYTLNFKGNPPWFIGTTVSSSTSVAGNTTLSVNIGDTRKTYPIFTIPSGITRITLTHSGTGKAFTLSGSHSTNLVVDCAKLTVTSGGSNAISFLTSSPDFGMYHVGSGTFSVSSSNVTGSGSVKIELTPRYER